MMNELDYWKQCISDAAEECNLRLTDGQLDYLAECVESGHDNYGMAFYSPPPSDRLIQIERDYVDKIKRLENEFKNFKRNADTAIKLALRIDRDAIVTIGEYGEVQKHGGRTEHIQ